MSDGALCSGVFDKFRNSKLLWYHHIRDYTHLRSLTGSYKSTPSIALILASSVVILSCLISSYDLVL